MLVRNMQKWTTQKLKLLLQKRKKDVAVKSREVKKVAMENVIPAVQFIINSQKRELMWLTDMK